MKTNFNLQTAKIVGTPADGFWSQVHTFSPLEKEKKEKRGELLAVLVVSGVEEGVEAVAVGREILGRLHEEYFGNLSGSAFERLGLAVKKVSEENGNLEIVAAAALGQVLYLAILGGGKVLLRRGDKIGALLSGSHQPSSRQVLRTASGYLEADDFLVLGSEEFFSTIGEGVLKAALETNSVTEAVEVLAPIVLGRNEMARAAAILAITKEAEDSSIKPVEAVPEPPEAKEPEGDFSPKKPIFLRKEMSQKKKKLYFLLSLLLLVFLSGGGFFGWQKRAETRREVQVKNLLKEAEEKLNQGKQLATEKPEEGKVLGAETQKLVGEVLSLKKDNAEAKVLSEATEKFLSSLATEIGLTEPVVFMDLGLISDGGKGMALSLSGNSLAILEASRKKVYLLDIQKKSQTIVDFPREMSLLTSAGGKLFLWEKEGIWAIEAQGKTAVLKKSKETSWKEIVGLASFGSNLYLLDKGSSAIWRYNTSSFAAGQNWFLTSSGLTTPISFAIDSSIWVLEKDKILKFNLGKPESFSLSKMPEGFIEPTKIYTSAETQFLYVLDKGQGKIFVIAKNGEFKKAYVWEGLKQADDLVAVESLNKLFVLSGTKIYSLDLK